MIIVSNTSPINYLILIGQINLRTFKLGSFTQKQRRDKFPPSAIQY